MDFPKYFFDRCKSLNITYKKFSEKSGLDPVEICNVELGRKAPSLSDISKYAKGFDIEFGSKEFSALEKMMADAVSNFRQKKVTNEEVLHRLPIFFRCQGEVTDKILDEIIEVVKR